MSKVTLRREGAVGNAAAPRPASYLVEAMMAVLDGEPDKPIALTPEVYVRATYLVAALAPEALERAAAFIAPQSVSSDVVERIQDYTKGAAA